ncbi:ribosome small subunit-dependent GTPase A [uncultured Clostridium sp.]|uniref:ribosome small subunit-dependent GTPase A n=1 Tax=uncultured Clostridium sp. TaxID=59620 RepID=UPI00262D56F6|nr:ribosome small subunit-dependent GTPase A [uncultured Clostridium sp.]
MEGRIIKGIGGFYYIKTDTDIIECKARGKFRHKNMKPMVGDLVDINVENGKGVIEEIHERSSELIRPTVANVTRAFVVFALKSPDIQFDLLNRFLVLCEHNDIEAIVCLNKEDLCSVEERERIAESIKAIGYQVLFINAKDGIGLEKLKEMIQGHITVLCGPSGAGKSTLSNTLINREYMETGELSLKIGRGKHTTRHSELIEIEDGYLVDTPGFSTVDLSFMDKDDLKFCFPEFTKYHDGCKYRGCNHYKEPKCAIKDNIELGNIDKLRYDFYIKRLEEILNGRVR